MMNHSIATILCFCSNEAKFFRHCLIPLQKFSRQIYIVAWDHFFDGTSENEQMLISCFEQFPQCQYFLAPFIPDLLPCKLKRKIGKDLWFNFSRMIGAHFAQEDYLLFLDADEIIDDSVFSQWLETNEYKNFDALRLENYWYFRSVDLQATTWEDSILLTKKGEWQKKALLSPGDRHAIYQAAKIRKRHVVGLQGLPMIHHYSWVRTKKEIIKKMECSNHKHEKPWRELIEDSWDNPFILKDFVHGYALKKVAPFIQLSSIAPSARKMPSFVQKIAPSDLLKIIGIPIWKRFLLHLQPKKA